MSDHKRISWTEWVKAIVIAFLVALLLKTYVFSTSIVEGESMDPTLSHGERIIFNKFVYHVGKPKHGDIVIIEKSPKYYVKRVIALPGETIEMREHTLYIDGEVFDQFYINEEARLNTGNFGPHTLPEHSYFVMGDNRAVSKDSRNGQNGLGFIKDDEIIGKSEFIYYPITEWSITR